MSDFVHLLTLRELRGNLDDWTVCWLMNWDAYDPDTKACLYSSLGNRKAGRPTKYVARHGNRVVHFTAWTLEDAVQKAHDKLNKYP